MSSKTLFRKSSLDSISSPDQLNDYIKVSNPSIWLVLAALFILLAAVFIWSFTGSLPTTVSAKGMVSKGSILCYVGIDDAGKIKAGQQTVLVKSDGASFAGQVAVIGDVPMSADEIAAELGSDYLSRELVQDGFAQKITITTDQSGLTDGLLIDVGIVTDSVRPVDFLLR